VIPQRPLLIAFHFHRKERGGSTEHGKCARGVLPDVSPDLLHEEKPISVYTADIAETKNKNRLRPLQFMQVKGML